MPAIPNLHWSIVYNSLFKLFPPELLAEDVTAKLQAMLAHWLDLDLLLARPNI